MLQTRLRNCRTDHLRTDDAYDLRSVLFDALTDGKQAGKAFLVEDLTVVNGVFVVDLDFGAGSIDLVAEDGVGLGETPAFISFPRRGGIPRRHMRAWLKADVRTGWTGVRFRPKRSAQLFHG